MPAPSRPAPRAASSRKTAAAKPAAKPSKGKKPKTAPAKKQAEPAMTKTLTLESGIKIRCRHDELRDLRELIRFPRNPNVHPPEQIRMLVKIVKQTGWRNPIVISTRSGFITKGHGRLDAAEIIANETGEFRVPIEFQDYANEAEEYADIVADNRIAELSALDAGVVTSLVEEARTFDGGADFDFEFFGYGANDFSPVGGDWGSGGKNNPSRHGETSEPGKSAIKITCPQGILNEVREAVTTALQSFQNVSID